MQPAKSVFLCDFWTIERLCIDPIADGSYPDMVILNGGFLRPSYIFFAVVLF